MSLSADGSVLAVGGYSDTYGFTTSAESSVGYDVTLEGVGATWIFGYNGTAYNQLEPKLVGTGYNDSTSQQGTVCAWDGLKAFSLGRSRGTANTTTQLFPLGKTSSLLTVISDLNVILCATSYIKNPFALICL